MSRRSTSHQDMAIDVNELNEPVPRAVYGSCRLSLAAIKKGDLLAFSFSESRIIVDSGCRVPVLSVASDGARQKGLVQSGRGFAHSDMPDRTEDPNRVWSRTFGYASPVLADPAIVLMTQ